MSSETEICKDVLVINGQSVRCVINPEFKKIIELLEKIEANTRL